MKFTKHSKNNQLSNLVSKVYPIEKEDYVVVGKLNYVYDKKTTDNLLDMISNNVQYDGKPLNLKIVHMENKVACLAMIK